MTRRKKRNRGRRPNGAGTVRRRANGRWQAISTTPPRSQAFDTKEEAERWLLRLQLHPSVAATKQNVGFASAITEWLAQHRAEIKPPTYESYHGIVVSHLIPAFGDDPLSSIDYDRVATYRASKLQGNLKMHVVLGGRTSVQNYRLSPTTVRYHLILLRQFMADAARRKWVDREVAEEVRAVKLPKRRKPRPVPLSPRVVDDIIRLLASAQHRFLVLFISSLGLRLGEALGSRLRDYDPRRRVLKVEKSLQRDAAKRRVLGDVKSEAGKRELRVDSVLHVAYVAYVRDILSDMRNSKGVLFPGQSGGLFEPDNFRARYFRPASLTAQLKALPPHEQARVVEHTPADFRVLVSLLTLPVVSIHGAVRLHLDAYDPLTRLLRYVDFDGHQYTFELSEEFGEQLARHGERAVQRRKVGRPLLFPPEPYQAEYWKLNTVFDALREGFAGADVDVDLRIHALRHLFASLSATDVQSLKRLSQKIGHADDSFTFATYVHSLEDEGTGGADSIGAMFAPLPGAAPEIDEDEDDDGHVVEPIGRLQQVADDEDEAAA